MKILLVTPSLPYPARSGAEQRTQLLCRALSELGTVDVIVAPQVFSEPLSSEEMQVLRDQFRLVGCLTLKQLGNRWPWRVFGVLGEAWPTRIGKLIRGAAAEYAVDPKIRSMVQDQILREKYEVVVFRYLMPFAMIRSEQMAPTLVDVDDFPSDVASRNLENVQVGSVRAWYWTRLLAGKRDVEHRLLASCRHAWVSKQSDLALAHGVSSSVLPNIPFAKAGEDDIEACAPAKDSRSILFVGTMGWGPNERAVDRFLAESWAVIREAEPEATFRIVGFGMSKVMRARWEAFAGVTPVGFAADLRTEYGMAAFTVCPVWEGGGSNIKVLESLRYGRTVVCTPCGARGFEHSLKDGSAILIRDDMRAFAEACIALLRDPTKATAMAEEGARVVAQQHSFAIFRHSVHAAVRTVA